ncbi:TetR/AcrR family transcriptional regulator [Sphingomonas flavalba]|uniref:TetR/AcrR family transcriptional regulator n=1 Tax=Sphingomonas flavalba TaxID=2559804 RepID=UPI00109DACA3|nr:TetR/AcrR family transcriptional regulator [Sphingomonas flavalba]
MRNLQARAKSAVRRQPRSREGTHQHQKSEATRTRLINATIQCLVKLGYARTNTSVAAMEAGMSRGSMLHHFKTRMALIEAVAVELYDRRLRGLQRSKEVAEATVGGIMRNYWNRACSPNFIALHELALAARTDPELAAILEPLNRAHREQWYREAAEVYSEWRGHEKALFAALTLSKVTIEGLALSRLTNEVDDAMVEPVLEVLEAQLTRMHDEIVNATTG